MANDAARESEHLNSSVLLSECEGEFQNKMTLPCESLGAAVEVN